MLQLYSMESRCGQAIPPDVCLYFKGNCGDLKDVLMETSCKHNSENQKN